MVFLVVVFLGTVLQQFPLTVEALKHYVNETAVGTSTLAGSMKTY